MGRGDHDHARKPDQGQQCNCSEFDGWGEAGKGLTVRECLRIHHEGHEGAQRLKKTRKICENLCNPWLNLVQVSTSTRSKRNFKTLTNRWNRSKTLPMAW